MMHPNPFNDDLQESGIPMFGKNGTALSNEERISIAKRRGLCLKCGTKTHQVKIISRSPLTNSNVHQGICIKCNNNAVPPSVLQEWQSRNAAINPTGHGPNRFKGAAHAARLLSHKNGPPGRRVSPPPPGGLITAEVAPLQGSAHNLPNRVNNLPNRSDNRSHSSGTVNRSASDMVASQKRSVPPSQPSVPMSNSSSALSPQNGLDSEEYKSSSDTDSWTLMKDIKDNRNKPDILRTKLHGFRNLADDLAGGMYEIKDTMDMYRNECRFMMVAMGAVWGISSRNDDKKQEAADTGCLEIIIDSLRNGKTKDDPEAVHWALGALASLAQLEDNKKYIADKGGIETIIEALKKHESNPSVFEWACRALYAMVFNYDTEGGSSVFDRDIATIQVANGIRQIVSAMKLHIPENVAQWWALKLLFRLQDQAEPAAAELTVTMMSAENLAATCMQIIKARSTSADVFVQAAEMLCLFFSCETNPLSQQNAVECIPNVMRFLEDESSNVVLQESAARLLAAIARGNNQAARQISNGSCVRSLLNTMAGSPDNVELQRAGIMLLWVLAGDESSFDYLLLGQIKETIEIASSSQPDDDNLNIAICGFVANVSAVAQGRGDSIPVDVVLRLSTNNSDGVVGQHAYRALCTVCANFPEVADRLVESSLCDHLLAGLCDSSVDVQSSSSAALAAIVAKSQVARTKIFESGGLATASAALFTTDSESLAKNLLSLVSTLVTGGSKKVLQLPNELIQAILQVMRSFPSLNKTACSTIRNAMLVTVPGFSSVSADGLPEMLTSIVDSPSNSDDLVIEACGAIWAYTAKQPIASSVTSELFRSVLGLCAKSKGENAPFNSPVLTEASRALASIMHCVREKPIHIPDNDIDLIISILDIVIECDVENVVLMDGLMDVVLTLCFLSKEILIQFGVIVVVIDCMVEHEGNEQIQEKGAAILAILASTENLQVNLSIAETDGIDMIVSALAGFTENLAIQTDACRALSHLSIDHESRMLISSQGGLILLVNAMNKFKDDVDLLEAACSALLNLSSDAEEQVLAGSSVIETVISTMRHQLNSPRLQEKSLGVLQNIAMRSKDAKKAIADAGGVGAVTFAIKEFMGSPTVLERAFTTTWSLAVLEENQQLVANEGGIGLVINGMMANITYEKVQKQACGCLCTLASNSRNKTLIRDLGGVDAIVYSMWAHYDSDALLVEAFKALSSLAVNVQTNEVMLASEGEISTIMSAMRRFPNSERLQEHACVALRNFLLSADNAAIVRGQAPELEQLMNGAAERFPDRCAERAKQVLASLR
jgi:predicted regulator of Ras-like GTPase activity (Roadblock/LC7/MglB family)